MLIPMTSGGATLVLLVAALLWGLWANTMRVDKKYRFELYAFDFAFGALLVAVLLAFTLGNLGSSASFTFEDNLTIASKRALGVAVGAGLIFCLGNMMTMAGISLAGLSTAAPVSAAMALIVTVIGQVFGKGPSSPGLVYGAAGVAILALVVAGLAQKAIMAATPVKRHMHATLKGFILSAVGGLILGAFPPAVESSRASEIGLGAYAAVVFTALGALLFTPLVNLYFLNLPVQGDPLPISAYLKATVRQHLTGLAGGGMWAGGAVALFAAAGGTYPDAPKQLAVLGAGYAGAVIAALCGLLLWSEPAGAPKAKGLLFGVAALLLAAAAMLYLGA